MEITLSFQVEVLRKELVIQAEKQQRVKQQVNEFCFKNTGGSEVERQLEACKNEMQGRYCLGDHNLWPGNMSSDLMLKCLCNFRD